MEITNSGVLVSRRLYPENIRKVFDIAIEHRRSMIKLPKDAMDALRFRSNISVLARLESMFTEERFIECPGPCIDSALLDAAQADYYYEHEKQYEESYFEDDTQGDEDDAE